MIEFHHVSYRRQQGEPDLLKDLSFRIERGEWVCIAGRNGSGKSSLVRLMNGLLLAHSGEIRIDGIRLEPGTLQQIRQKVGMVFAHPDDQFVGLTVADDLAFGLENRAVPPEDMRQRVEAIADQFQIKHLLERHPARLSGGQKQRVALASVMATQPSILICDEATSMLDESAKKDILDMLRAMHRLEPRILISVTHDPDEMAAADRLMIVSDGVIAADGKPADLLQDEALLARCGLEMPYTLKLCKALRERGMDIGNHLEEGKVLNALWAYHSKRFPSITVKEE